MAQLDLRCPTCGFADEVRKVSTVVGESVNVVPGEYGTYRYPTSLANSLARPAESTRANAAGFGVVAGIVLVLLGVGGLLLDEGRTLGLSVTFIVVGLMLGIRGYSSVSRDDKGYRDRLARLPKTEERWNQLYYCHRDETVFNPYDGTSMSVEQVQPYLDNGPS